MTEKIRAIVVDDESSARDILRNLLGMFCPEVEVVADYPNLRLAVEGIKEHGPDVVFLDIEMPNYAGFEIVSFFSEPEFEIIFVTAYDHYAIKAFEVAALDYLLKPIDIPRLKQAVARLSGRIGSDPHRDRQFDLLQDTLQGKAISKLAIIDKGYRYRVDLDEVVAIEAQESYSKLHFRNGEHALISKNLRNCEQMLDSHPDFFRSHKSWIINRNFLRNYSRSQEEINLQGGLTAKLSRYRKKEFEDFLAGTT